MNCERCGQANPGASWYCTRCGAPLDDLNVADSGVRRPLPTFLKWSLAITAFSLLLVAGVALLTLGSRGVRELAEGRRTGSASDAWTPVPGSGTVGEPTSAGAVPHEPATAAATSGGDGDEVTRVLATEPKPGTSPGDGLATAVVAAGSTPTAALTSLPTSVLTSSTAVASLAPTDLPELRQGAPIWPIARVSVPPKMDGKLDDWGGEPLNIAAVVFGSDFWDGPEDLSASAYGAWDDEALYIAVHVVDDYFSQPSRGRQIHLSDSIELQLDVDLAGDLDSDAYSSDDWQMGVSPGDFAGNAPDVYVWRPLSESIEAVRTGSYQLDNGYIVEFAVPWTLLGFDSARTRSLGIALNVSDNDDPRPAQLTMISSAPDRSWSDPRTFATLVLVD